MAPLFEAVNVEYVGSVNNDIATFKGTVDKEWTIGKVPHGGYLLALVIEACIDFQARIHPRHPDPFHVSAHYLNRSSIAAFGIRVKRIKTGSSFSNLTAELVQNNQVNLMAHLVFGNFTDKRTSAQNLTVEPPSPFARRIPIYHHPSQHVHPDGQEQFKYSHRVKISEDHIYQDHNKPENKAKLFKETTLGPDGKLEKLGGGGIESVIWYELRGSETDRIRPSLIAFVADITHGFPAVLPDIGAAWHPTITLSIQFFFPIPSASSLDHASRTFGLYGTSNFMVDPHGRHDTNVEVWTAPTNIGDGEIREGWRDKQVCLAFATQMALTMPRELVREKPRL